MNPEPTQAQAHAPKQKAPTPGQPALHRVCTQCNNMFRVAPENYDAKQCPNCRKG